MRILALDHGSVRIGVAVSDELKIIAQPLEFIAAEPFAAFLERLQQILREKEVELIVVGLPRNMNGSYGPAAQKVQEFVEELRQELKDHVRNEIGALAVPDDIHFTTALPKTRSGKIMRRLLRDVAAGRETVGDTSTLEDYSVLARLRTEDE